MYKWQQHELEGIDFLAFEFLHLLYFRIIFSKEYRILMSRPQKRIYRRYFLKRHFFYRWGRFLKVQHRRFLDPYFS